MADRELTPREKTEVNDFIREELWVEYVALTMEQADAYELKLHQAQLDYPHYAHMIDKVIDYVRYPEVSCEVVDQIEVNNRDFGSKQSSIMSRFAKVFYDPSGKWYEFEMNNQLTEWLTIFSTHNLKNEVEKKEISKDDAPGFRDEETGNFYNSWLNPNAHISKYGAPWYLETTSDLDRRNDIRLSDDWSAMWWQLKWIVNDSWIVNGFIFNDKVYSWLDENEYLSIIGNSVVLSRDWSSIAFKAETKDWYLLRFMDKELWPYESISLYNISNDWESIYYIATDYAGEVRLYRNWVEIEKFNEVYKPSSLNNVIWPLISNIFFWKDSLIWSDGWKYYFGNDVLHLDSNGLKFVDLTPNHKNDLLMSSYVDQHWRTIVYRDWTILSYSKKNLKWSMLWSNKISQSDDGRKLVYRDCNDEECLVTINMKKISEIDWYWTHNLEFRYNEYPIDNNLTIQDNNLHLLQYDEENSKVYNLSCSVN